MKIRQSCTSMFCCHRKRGTDSEVIKAKKIRKSYQFALLLILLLGLALRLAPWGQNRFLEDEALYATWGLQIATGADPLLDEEPVDKPPLHLYTLALSFSLFSPPSVPPACGGEGPKGQGGLETAARLPSLFASVVSIALVYALAKSLYPRRRNSAPARAGSQSGARARTVVRARQGVFSPSSRYGDRVGLLAALLLALSPFDILFASTAFTDPLLVAWALAALLAAAKGRLGVAGLLIGLAAATKQQGLFFLPLVVALGLWGAADRRDWRSWARFALGFALVAGGVVWWDSARVQRPGFLEQGLISYGGLGPAEPANLGERAVEWLRLVGGFWVSPGFNVLLLAAGIGCLATGLWYRGAGRRKQGPDSPIPDTRPLILGGFVMGFLALHWLVGFQVWDRYLLGLVPLMAILAARVFVGLGAAIRTPRRRRAYAVGLGALLVVLLIGPVLRATRSELPYGGDHGAYDGIDELAEYLHQNAPPSAVLYHHWLGYHYRFYLHGVPLRRHWYPDPADLAHDATVYRREPRYIAFPSFRDSSAARAALAEAGITLAPVLETRRRDGTVSFRLYRLKGPGGRESGMGDQGTKR